MATEQDVRDLLAATTLPAGLVDDLLAGASAMWLIEAPAEVLATDLALCHPPLGPQEVRAAVNPTESEERVRLTIVAADRPGLLAGIAGTLAEHGLWVSSVSATTWPGPQLALLRLFVESAEGAAALARVDWDALGEGLRSSVGRHEYRPVEFLPTGPVEVSATPEESGRSVVTLHAPAQRGLTWAIARWFEDHDTNIELAKLDADPEAGTVTATLVVVCPDLDAAALAASLAGAPAEALPVRFGKLAARSAVAVGGVGAALALKGIRSLVASRRK